MPLLFNFQKLLTMLPSEEERTKIQEAQTANPELPLGSAEQFLLTLASIIELPARLKLWAFKLDYENSEKVSTKLLLFYQEASCLLIIGIIRFSFDLSLLEFHNLMSAWVL